MLVHPHENDIKTALDEVLIRVRLLLLTFNLFDEHKKLHRIEYCAVRYKHVIELFAEIVHKILTVDNEGTYQHPEYSIDTEKIRQQTLQVDVLMQEKLGDAKLSFQATFLLADSIHAQLKILIDQLSHTKMIQIVNNDGVWAAQAPRF